MPSVMGARAAVAVLDEGVEKSPAAQGISKRSRQVAGSSWSGLASIRRPLVFGPKVDVAVRLSACDGVPFPGDCETYWDVLKPGGFAERHLGRASARGVRAADS